MSFGFGFGFPKNYVAALFNTPASLFTTGVNGAWYDPSDFSTLFQDRAGTTPVTAVGQPVGRILDKSGRGNHAFNPSGNSANFPVLSARYNLLTKTEQFDGATWLKTNLTATANKLTSANLTGIQAVDSTSAAYPAGVYIFSIKVKSDGWRWVQLRTNISLSSSYVNFDVISGVKGTESGAIGSITALGVNEYLISISLTFLAASGAISITLVDSGTATRNPSVTGNGVSGIFVRDADLRVTNDALNQPAYQRVNTATDYDTVGFKPYLSFKGVNQWLQTNSIDFTYGDKMFVSAGVRKLADGAEGTLVGFSTSSLWVSNGFELSAPQFQGSKNGFGLQVVGNLSSNYTGYTSGFPSPVTSLISGVIDIGGASFSNKLKMRVNGSDQALTSVSNFTPTGNFTTQAMFIGGRGGTANWLNGRLYGLVVAGKAASTSEITNTEAWLNQKTGAY